MTKVGRIDLKLERTDKNWDELVWGKLDLERIDLYPLKHIVNVSPHRIIIILQFAETQNPQNYSFKYFFMQLKLLKLAVT